MKLKILWLYLTFATMVIVPALVGWHIRSNRNPELGKQYTDTAKALIAKKNFDGAMATFDFIIDHGLDEDGTALSGKKELQQQMESYWQRVKDFAGGAIYGEIENTSSMVGCVMADVCVYGDIRDFAKNSYRYYSGQEVDEINAILASLGLATTILPNLDVGLSVCKNFARFMTGPVRKFILELFQEAVKLRKFEKVDALLASIGGLYRSIGAGVLDILQVSKDSQELMKLIGLMKKHGRTGYAFFMLGGKGAVRFLETATEFGLTLTGSTGRRILGFALKYPQVGIRILKISKKIGWDHFDVGLVAFAELLAAVPLRFTVGAFLLLWLWVHLIDLLSIIGRAFRVRSIQPAVG